MGICSSKKNISSNITKNDDSSSERPQYYVPTSNFFAKGRAEIDYQWGSAYDTVSDYEVSPPYYEDIPEISNADVENSEGLIESIKKVVHATLRIETPEEEMGYLFAGSHTFPRDFMKETKIALRVLTAWSEEICALTSAPRIVLKETVFHRLTINGHIVTDVALSKKGGELFMGEEFGFTRPRNEIAWVMFGKSTIDAKEMCNIMDDLGYEMGERVCAEIVMFMAPYYLKRTLQLNFTR